MKKFWFLLAVLCFSSCTATQRRAIERFDVSVFDYEYFPARTIGRGETVRVFDEKIDPNIAEYFTNSFNCKNLDEFFEKTQTQAMIVVKDDSVVFEKYGTGFNRNSIVTSFSVAKVFNSAMIGCLIEEGKIASEKESIAKWLPELLERDAGFEKITIEDLMKMCSGIKYSESGIFGDDTETYWNPGLRQLALEKTKIAEEPGMHFLYNNYNPLLLGLIIERASGLSVAEYLSRCLWAKIGAEADASWSLDSRNDAFEKMESGINATAMDFARFGCLFRDKGRAMGQQVVSAEWIEKCLADDGKGLEYYGYKNKWGPQVLKGIDGGCYGYFWYIMRRNDGDSDFFAYGNLGQIIYISPKNNTVTVRFGCKYGIDFWDYIRAFYNFSC